MKPEDTTDLTTEQQIEETIEAFVEIVLTEKFADMPNWMDFDLTVSQVKAIYTLAYHETLTVGALARSIGMGDPAASILVQELVEQNLVKREQDSQDRRRAFVRLTERGAELVQGRRDRREVKFKRRLGQLSQEERACLLLGVRALRRVMRAEQE